MQTLDLQMCAHDKLNFCISNQTERLTFQINEEKTLIIQNLEMMTSVQSTWRILQVLPTVPEVLSLFVWLFAIWTRLIGPSGIYVAEEKVKKKNLIHSNEY